MEYVKIRTKKNRIYTLKVTKRDLLQVSGFDKYKKYTIIPFSDIDSMLPIEDEK